jgi:hypothetical protein
MATGGGEQMLGFPMSAPMPILQQRMERTSDLNVARLVSALKHPAHMKPGRVWELMATNQNIFLTSSDIRGSVRFLTSPYPVNTNLWHTKASLRNSSGRPLTGTESKRSSDSSATIVTTLRTGRRFPARAKHISLFHSALTASLTHPAFNQDVPGGGGVCLEIKRSGCETDNLHPSSVEVKNTWSYTSTPPYI